MNVLVVGAEAAGLRAVRVVHESGRKIVGIVTDDEDLSRLGSELGLTLLPADVVEEPAFARWVEAHEVDILLNVHSLHILHSEVLRAPTIGSFNLHPGPLPRYAGLMAPSWALFSGESSHAVTLHWLDEGIDTGPVAYASTFLVSENDTGLSVSARCVKEGIPLVKRLLGVAQRGADAIPRVPQDVLGRQYFGRRPPNDGCISWGWEARRIVDFVRACDYAPFTSPWGHPKARLGDRDLFVLKATRAHGRVDVEPGTVGVVGDGGVLVAAGDEWVRVLRLKLDGEYLPAAGVVRPGDHLCDGVATNN